MTHDEALLWAQEHNITLSEQDDKPFAIVYWRETEAPLFEAAMKALGVADYGTDDLWDTCAECGRALDLGPSYFGADYYPSDDGRICTECTDPDYYVEWYNKHLSEGRMVGFLLDPEKLGYSKVVSDLENGFHEGQADDPHAITEYASSHNLQVAFKVVHEQFTQSFAVYMRRDTGEWFHDEESIAAMTLGLDEVEAIRADLTKDGEALKSEYRESPTLAQRCKATLKAVTGQ